jgi:hypothetical protein
MSLYREVGGRGRRLAIVIAASLAVGALAGLALGRATAPEPTLQEQVEQLRHDAEPVSDALELVAIHYAAKDPVTRNAAREQLRRAQELFSRVQPRLTLLAPEKTRAAQAAIVQLASHMELVASPAVVERAANEARAAVRAAAGLR